MDYIYENTTDHKRAQMGRATIMLTPNDKMTSREIYEEMWKLDAKCNKEETIGTTHDTRDKKVERMTKDDRKRLHKNETQMKTQGTGIYAQVTEYTE